MNDGLLGTRSPLQRGAERGEFRLREQIRQLPVQPSPTQFRHQPRCDQAVAAENEEVVVATDIRRCQQRLPDAADQPLDLAERRPSRMRFGSKLPFGLLDEVLSVDFAVGGQRKLRHLLIVFRYGIFRQPGRSPLA